MKKIAITAAVLTSLSLLLTGCGSNGTSQPSTDADSGATAAMLPLDTDVTLRVGTGADGAIILDSSMMEGFFASDHYTDENPYGFALVLTADGKKQLRSSTRELAKEQSKITLWADGNAISSPTVTSMLNTKFVILNIASVTDDASYRAVVEALQADSAALS